MQMQLKQAHIEAAIRDFVAKAGITFAIDEINFTAGRGKDGLTATIDLEDPFATLLDSAAQQNAPKPKATPKAETVEETPEEEKETPDQAFVADEEEPPFSDPTPVAQEIPSPPKANGASLFTS